MILRVMACPSASSEPCLPNFGKCFPRLGWVATAGQDRPSRPAGNLQCTAGDDVTEAGPASGRAASTRTRVTLQDVADRAGVSLATASRVLSDGPRRVGRQLAGRVNQAATELGYTANLQARAVATGQSSMVGVVVHDIADPYFSSI